MNRWLVLVVVGAVLMVASSVSADGHKTDICHNNHTINVALSSLAAHEAHGDIACSCETIEECADSGGTLDAATCECGPLYSALCGCVDASGGFIEFYTGACVRLDYCAGDGLFYECFALCSADGYVSAFSSCDPAYCWNWP